MDTREFNEIIAANSSWISALRTEVGKVVIGQQALVDRLILSLLCKGHVLLEGVPGLAKTLSVKAMAGTLHAQFARIQFTPDLLPADLLGTMIYNPEERQFTAKKGPIFANLILADEINRASPKTQSALLEAMQAAGQPWAVSSLAQAAGLAALDETAYVAQVRALIAQQRPRLTAGLRALGLRVLDGRANYLLFQGPETLGDALRQWGVVLRSCSNYPGLDGSWYRTAVRTGPENDELLKTLAEVLA